MPFISVTKEIRAPREMLYELAKDMASFPEFMEDLDAVIVKERGDGYTITEWHARLQGKPMVWTERDDFDDANCHITYHQIAGDLKTFEGEWRFETTEEGTTKVTLTVTFDLGIPMFAGLLNPVATILVRKNTESMLNAFKEKVEA